MRSRVHAACGLLVLAAACRPSVGDVVVTPPTVRAPSVGDVAATPPTVRAPSVSDLERQQREVAEAVARCQATAPRLDTLPGELNVGAAMVVELAAVASQEPAGADVSVPTRTAGLLGKWLADFSSRPALEWTFLVLDSRRPVAFAAPGGFVVVTTALLERLTDESQLAFVLAHEVAHVASRHQVRALARQEEVRCRLVTGLLAADSMARSMMKDLDVLLPADAGVPTLHLATDELVAATVRALPAPDAARDELAADRDAVQMMVFAGLDARRAADVLTAQPGFCLFGGAPPAERAARAQATLEELAGFAIDARARPMR